MVLITLVLINNLISAGTSVSIGDGVAIIRPEVGDTLHRSVLVINPNEFSVTVNLSASEDPKNEVVLIDKIIKLGPGEQKKAYFDINVKEPGRRQIKIGFLYIPDDEEESVVGVSARYTLIVGKDYEFDDYKDPESDEEQGNLQVDLIGDVVDSLKGSGESIKKGFSGLNVLIIMLSLMSLLLLVFLVLLVSLSKRKINKNKESK